MVCHIFFPREIEDEMVGWQHQLDRCEFEQTLGDSEGQEAWDAAAHGITELDVTG